jgi:hypothetical protein
MIASSKSTDSIEDLPLPVGRFRWIGRALTTIAVLFLTFDAVVKILFVPNMPEAAAGIGWDAAQAPTLGVVLLFSTLLYALPRTSFLGALLLTAYFGGAVATHLRVESPLFTHILFGVYIGAIVWGGLMLRDARVARLFSIGFQN